MEEILIPVIIMTAIGLIAAVVLSFASKLFSVKEDAVYLSLRAELPGANCGGCGYAGCDDYAHALSADHNLACDRCSVGGETTAAALADILGKSVDSADKKVAFVRCAGSSDKAKSLYTYQDITSCQASKQLFGGHKVCSHGCLGLGDCAAVCPFNAISIINGVAIVDKTKCKACGKCLDICPNALIALVSASAAAQVRCMNTQKGAETKKACTVGCLGCRLCEKICPQQAITISKNLSSIAADKCIGCGACVEKCPTGAITTLAGYHV